MKKQMTHANRRNIPYVVLVGEEELNSGTYTFKNMKSGEQSKLKFEELLSLLQ
jgi:histidyl-tRNA synthetase